VTQPGLGRAPVDVVVSEVENPLGGEELGDQGIMDVLDALGIPVVPEV